MTRALASVVSLSFALAGQAGAEEFRFAGFGTASLSCLTADQVDFTIQEQSKGPGRSGRCDGALDSVLGLRADWSPADRVEASVQGILARDIEHDLAASIDVAQLRWQLGETTTLRLGRMPTASFLHEEDRKIRYSQPWVRPPAEVYGLVPTYANDGVDIIHVGRLGGWTAEWHGGATRSEFDSHSPNAADGYQVESEQVFLNLTLSGVNTQYKFSYGYSHPSVSNPGIEALLAALRAQSADGAALARALALEDHATRLFALGMKHERDSWLVLGEIGYRDAGGYPRDQLGAYITLGYREGKWMSYVTLARRSSRGPDSDARAGYLSAPVEQLLATTRYDSSSLAVGVTREIGERAVFKVQADRIRPDDRSWGLYTNHGPDYDYGHPGADWLLTLSLDFVF